MKVKIEIDCDNEVFGGRPHNEVVRILRELSDEIEAIGEIPKHIVDLYDLDGNQVGTFKKVE